MNTKHRRTLRAVFAKPRPKAIRWADVESLLIAVGCEISQGTGSRIRVQYGIRKLGIHRPHGKDCDAGLISSVRDFLESIDVEPDDL